MATNWGRGLHFGVGLIALAAAFSASAAVIRSPQTAVIDFGGPGSGSIANTLNQSGLSINFVAGVTDFDAYLSQSPSHSEQPSHEWFSEFGTSSATVTYDFGSPSLIDRLALWNEDASGIGLLNLLYSADGITFSPLASGIAPFNNLYNTPYVAQVFSFTAVNARYVRFEMSNCPQLAFGSFQACAIGEVAFSSTPAQTVPEPITVSLLGLGVIGLAVLRRRTIS